MDFFEKHKALILATLFCSVVVLALYNFNLSRKQKKLNEMIVNLEQPEAEEDLEQEEQEQETPEPEPEPPENTPETHRAFDENQEEREENFNKQIEEIFERNSAQEEESREEENTGEGEYNMNRENRETREESHGDNSSENTSAKEGSLRNSSISYSLKGRNAVQIPNPVYTCDRPGKVVVNIKVDAAGRVTHTSINKNSSNTTNQCLTEKALQYAAGATFSRLDGRNEQPGTITYYFKP